MARGRASQQSAQLSDLQAAVRQPSFPPPLTSRDSGDSADASSSGFGRKSSLDSEQEDAEEENPLGIKPAGSNFTDGDGNEYLQDQSPEDDASLLVRPADSTSSLMPVHMTLGFYLATDFGA